MQKTVDASKIKQARTKFGIKINAKNTKIMKFTLNKDEMILKIKIDNEEKEFSYLGILINDDGKDVKKKLSCETK